MHKGFYMKKIYSVLIAIGIVLVSFSFFKKTRYLPHLKEELLEMMAKDQELRMKTIAGTNPDLINQIEELDKKHAQRMHEILDHYGWPGIDRVGNKGSNAAWLLIQHADHDILLQQRALQLMEKEVKNANASEIDFAYLVDRILINSGKPQKYGTQLQELNGHLVPKPIEDETTVDQLRKEVGMQPLKEYIEFAESHLFKK